MEIPEGSHSLHPAASALVGGMESGYALLVENSSCGAGFWGDAWASSPLVPKSCALGLKKLRARRKTKFKYFAMVANAVLRLWFLLPRVQVALPVLPVER